MHCTMLSALLTRKKPLVCFAMNTNLQYDEALVEPQLDEMFEDPIVKALMKKDGVVVSDLKPMLEQIAREFESK